jgi:8-oxo-dGTP pyrophosphatase MutT (NUDIX family)
MTEHLEKLNPGPPTEPRPAASVILLRRGGKHSSRGLEVLLVKRTPSASFMANMWVFPGGAVERAKAVEQVDDAAYRATALRELEEEASISLSGPDQLFPFSRWITPVEVRTRFDTRFYLALAPAHCAPQPDHEEIVDAAWFAPGDALERNLDGRLALVFPTIKLLEALLEFRSSEEALSAAHSRVIEPILPRVVVENGGPRVLLPGEPGYDDRE